MLRNKRCQVRQGINSDPDNFLAGRHFEIKFCLHCFAKKTKVTIVNVSSVLTKVADNPFCPGELAQAGSNHGVRLDASPRLAYCRNMVNINCQPHKGSPELLLDII